MLIFRKEQLEVLAQGVHSQFENRLQTWIRQQYPQQARVFGEEPLQAFVQTAVERAFGHGLDSRQACSRYVAIGLRLGAFFDHDPQLPWARDTLQDPGLDASRKSNRLRLLAARYTGVITGPGNSHLHAALERLQALAASPDFSGFIPYREVSIADLMQTLYPQKYATSTPEIRDAFAKEARRKITDYGLTDRPTMILLMDLMFLLGSGCDRDPLYPWIREILGNHAPDPAVRGQWLLAGFRAYLQQIVATSGGEV